MKRIFQFLLIFSLVISCTSNTIYKKPNDLIEKELMVELILNMQIATSARGSRNLNEERNIDYMYLVYNKFEIDSARFARSNFYYSTKIDDYTKILQEVKRRLEALEEEQMNPMKIYDSIKLENSRAKRIKKKENKKLRKPVETIKPVVK